MLESDAPRLAREAEASRIAALGVGLRAVLLLGIGFVLYQALTLRVFYWDTWDYLNEARYLAGDATGNFRLIHAPLPQLVLVPAAWIARAAEASDAVFWIAPTLTALVWSTALLGLSYGWLRHRYGAEWALFGVLLVVSTRLFIRYAAHPMVDIPSAVWAVAALWCYEVACDRAALVRVPARPDTAWLWLGVCFAGATLCKYPLAILPIPFIAAELVRVGRRGGVSRPHLEGLVLAVAVGFGLAFAGVAAVHTLALGNFDPAQILLELQEATAIEWIHESPFEYLAMASATISPLSLALFAIGAWQVARRRAQVDLAASLWLVFYAALMAFGLEHNEIRYLWPLAPVFAFLAVDGARACVSYAAPWQARLSPGSRRATPLLVAVLAGLVIIAPAVDQAHRDLGSFYRDSVLIELAQFVREASEPGRPVYWEGGRIALTPPDPAPIQYDEFFDVFHIGGHTLSYLTRRSVVNIAPVESPRRFLQSLGGHANVLVRGPSTFNHATTWLDGRALPPDFAVFGQRRVELRARGKEYFDDAGTPLLGWAQARAGSAMELRAIHNLEPFGLFRLEDGRAVPIGAVPAVRAGELLRERVSTHADGAPPALVLVTDTERHFKASRADNPRGFR